MPDEEWTPRVEPAAPRLFITLAPPEGAKGVKLPRIQSWADLGTWMDELGAGQCDTNPALVETAQRLASGTSDRLALLRAACAHVQKIRYVAVDRGLGLGFGYRPRKATEVLTRGYGDCKDKANLLRAILREHGITAHTVAIESGRRHPTVAEFPSAYQFNHVINAIEVDASVDLPSVVTVPDGRRLLLFDPTDEHTIVGDLPYYLQGATGLVLLGADSFLLELPELPHDEEWNFGTTATVTIAANGSTEGHVETTASRQAGALARGLMRRLNPKDRTDLATRWMGSMLRGVTVQDPTFTDDPVSGENTFAFNFKASGIFQPGPGGIYMLRLDVLSRDTVPQLGTKERVQPLEVRPIIAIETVTFALPNGFAVEDVPKDASVQSPYGMYVRTVTVNGTQVVLQRELRLKPQIVAPGDVAEVRAFLNAAGRADKAAVVLRRTP